MIWIPCVHRLTMLSFTNNANKGTTLLVLLFQVNELRLIKICLSGTFATCPADITAAFSGSGGGGAFHPSGNTTGDFYPAQSEQEAD